MIQITEPGLQILNTLIYLYIYTLNNLHFLKNIKYYITMNMMAIKTLTKINISWDFVAK